jgi:hypothetical protein
MRGFSGHWVGTVYGTNHGNAFLEIDEKEGKLSGTIRILDQVAGLLIYSFTGSGDDMLRLDLRPERSPDGVELSTGEAVAILQPNGTLTGRWETAGGTAGTFLFARQNVLDRTGSGQAEGVGMPTQVYYHSKPLGSIRLYRKDLEAVFAMLRQDFAYAQPIVTHLENGVQVTKFADGFLADPPRRPLRALKVSIQEAEPTGLQKMVHIDLIEGVGSEVRTSSPNQSWVIGKAESLRSALHVHENRLVSWYRRYGLTINMVLFALMLVAVPEIEAWVDRLVFVGLVYGALMGLAFSYNRFIPNTLILGDDPDPSWWSRAWPTVLSWAVTATASLFAMWLFWYFTQR